MRRLIVSLAILVVMIWGAWAMAPTEACAGSCGIKPIRPIPPIGCRSEMVAQCVCDSNGQNCNWQWVCSG